jgi:hypothetical protein
MSVSAPRRIQECNGVKPWITGVRMVLATLLAASACVVTAQPRLEIASAVAAQDHPDTPSPGAGKRRSASEAARIAEEQNGGGRVLDVRPAQGGYRVLVEKDGDVRMLFIPET